MKRFFKSIAITFLLAAPVLLPACGEPKKQTARENAAAQSQSPMQLVSDKGQSPGNITIEPPKDLPSPWNGSAGGGDRGGTVKCEICTKYCSVPQYDSNGRPTRTVQVACGTYSCNCGA